jgi:zinc protease
MPDHSTVKPFSERVRERYVGPCRLLTLPTPVRSVVTWRGSVRTYPDFEAGDELLQSLTASLLDKGTKRRDRFAIAEILENRGAEVHFGADGLHVDFSGRMLREDTADVLEIVAEQLREPLFSPEEFEKARTRLAGALQRSMESTRAQASAALARRLYPPAHPNYAEDAEQQLARLQTIGIDDVLAYHRSHFGATELTLVCVGDLDDDAIEGVVRDRLGDWEAAAAEPRFAVEAVAASPGRSVVSMPDKENVDVRMGHALELLRSDDDYEPLYVANYVLGGNFAARLMTVIRDEMGLTYGIRSNFSGISADYHGHWQVGVTLSTENVERGIAATLDEVKRFADGGVTADELDDKKTTITGSFKVGLATTAGLASALLNNAERGFDVSYLDEFPGRIEALTLERVNGAVRRHFDPERFHFALAGTVS